MIEVNKVLKVLQEMPPRAEGTKGVSLISLSKETQELATRCECASLSYIFILPECYSEARRALITLRTWLDEDMKYNKFVRT